MKKSFRCKNCGRLEPASHAGELAKPLSCSVCDAGVSWDKGRAIPNPDNWEVLADATPEVLAKLGLKAEDVERHVVKKKAGPAPQPQNLVREASDGVKSTDKA